MKLTAYGTAAIAPIAAVTALITFNVAPAPPNTGYIDHLITGAIKPGKINLAKKRRSVSSVTADQNEHLFQTKGCPICHMGPNLGIPVSINLKLISRTGLAVQPLTRSTFHLYIKPLIGSEAAKHTHVSVRQQIINHHALFPVLEATTAPERSDLATYLLSLQSQLPTKMSR